MSKQKPIDQIKKPLKGVTYVDRNQTRVVGPRISLSSVLRLEADGKLTPCRFTDSPKAKVYYKLSQVMALFGLTADEVDPPPSPPLKHAQKIPSTVVIDGRTFVEVTQ